MCMWLEGGGGGAGKGGYCQIILPLFYKLCHILASENLLSKHVTRYPLQFVMNQSEAWQFFSSLSQAVHLTWGLLSTFFGFTNLVIDLLSIHLVCATPHTIFCDSFWIFAGLLLMVCRCACDLGVMMIQFMNRVISPHQKTFWQCKPSMHNFYNFS